MAESSSTNKTSHLTWSIRHDSFNNNINGGSDLELQEKYNDSDLGEQKASSTNLDNGDEAIDDENENYNDEQQKKDDKLLNPPMREVRFSRGIFAKQNLAFNPLTSFIGFALLWGAAIWCTVSCPQTWCYNFRFDNITTISFIITITITITNTVAHIWIDRCIQLLPKIV